jgi:hypothetical protein
MQKGNWMPIDKDLVNALPKKRPYTLLEAAFSYQLDLDNTTVKGFRDYERLWQWSYSKTANFIKNQQGTKTEEAMNTKGLIKFRFIEKDQINQIAYKEQAESKQRAGLSLFSEGLGCSKEQAKSRQEATKEQAKSTTIILNINKYIVVFEELWKDYPNKEGKKDALKHFTATVRTDRDAEDIRKALKNYLHLLKIQDWRSPKLGKTWFKTWRDFETIQGTSSGVLPSSNNPDNNSVLDKIRKAEVEVETEGERRIHAYTEI